MTLKHLKNFLPAAGCAVILASAVLAVSLKTSCGAGTQIALPGSPKGTTSLASYIRNLFIFGLSLAGFLAVAAIAWGGILWMMGGSITSLEKAKGIIVGAISGLVLLMSSYLLLYTIDPKLTDLTPPSMRILNAPPPIPTTLSNTPSTPTGPRNKYERCETRGYCTMAECANGGTCPGSTWNSQTCKCNNTPQTSSNLNVICSNTATCTEIPCVAYMSSVYGGKTTCSQLGLHWDRANCYCN